jgi:hypothetical protein
MIILWLAVPQSAATTLAGTRAGLAQGELQAALSNIRTLCSIVSPLVWGWVYAAGASRGRAALFYWVSAGVVALEWFATLGVSLSPPASSHAP